MLTATRWTRRIRGLSSTAMKILGDLVWGVAALAMIVAIMIVVPPIVFAVVLGPPLLVTWALIEATGLPWIGGLIGVPAWIGWALVLVRIKSARKKNRSKLTL
jgi:hypothetical protein